MNSGYYKAPEVTARAWRNGWFHTGDAFRHDEDGFFSFVDRMKDAIRRRGENISSFEVEAQVILEPPGDRRGSGRRRTRRDLEDEVKVVLVRPRARSSTHAELVDFLRPTMPDFMVPRYVEFLDELPKTPTATVRTQKVKLREQVLNERTWDRETGTFWANTPTVGKQEATP